MSYFLTRSLFIACLFGASVGLLSGCDVAPVGAYSYNYGGPVGVDYYQPSGFNFGGWGPGYRLAPSRGDGRPFVRGRPNHTFRPARPGRPMPSIPGGGRPGGGHSGGPRGSGGHSGGGGRR
jgi:hypothetical protein